MKKKKKSIKIFVISDIVCVWLKKFDGHQEPFADYLEQIYLEINLSRERERNDFKS